MSNLVQLLLMGYGGRPSSADADVQAWIDRVYADGETLASTTVAAVDTFVAAAKADGYFSTFRRLNLNVGATLNAALHPLINTSGAAKDTAVGGLSYDESTGFVSDGTGYIDTGYTPTETTGGLSVYLRTAQVSEAVKRILIGANGSSQFFRMGVNLSGSDGATAGAARAQWGGSASAANSTGGGTGSAVAGLWHQLRPSTTELRALINWNGTGTQIGATNTTLITASTPSRSIYVFADNDGGVANDIVAASTAIAAWAVDNGMSLAQASLYRGDLQAFQTTMGRNV
jgi:hypothetical protein